MINRIAAIACVVGLAACGTTPAEQAQLVAAGQSLAMVAAAHNTSASEMVAKGTLFCQKATAATPLVVALANLSGAPVTVTDQTATQVTTACAAVQGIPVPPPADPASVPVVVSGTTLPAA